MIRILNWKLIPLCMLFAVGGVSTNFAQGVLLEGYVFESDNRGYLNEVRVTIRPKGDPENKLEIHTDKDGYFKVLLPATSTFLLTAEKPLFFPTNQDISTYDKKDGEKIYGKIELNRQPGYYFDVTLAQEKTDEDSIVEGITGARIEIFNNTLQENALVLNDYPHPNFSYTFQQGNHYTILIRKSGYFAKRLEALVNVDGCILCFDGLSSIESVTDNLTVGHKMGSILANIALTKANRGASFKIDNIFYDLNESKIRADAALELDKIVGVLMDNREVRVELGSHTDSRGDSDFNQRLSQRRADSAVAFLISKGVSDDQISAQGYGESKLINDCKDGASCSEQAHQKNRRTEIKVMDITQRAIEPLSEIKRIEQMEETLRLLENQEIIEVGPGSKIPDDLKAILAENQSATADTTSTQASGISQDTSGGALVLDMDEEEGMVTDRMQVEEQPMVKEQKATSRTTEMDAKTQKESRFLSAIGGPSRKTKSILLFPEVPEDFTGFMIQIIVSESALETLDEKLNSFPIIRQEKTAHGQYKYLVGTFTQIIDALDYFDEKIQESYPNAKIIEFISGKRL